MTPENPQPANESPANAGGCSGAVVEADGLAEQSDNLVGLPKLCYSVGDRIRVNHWRVPRPRDWVHGIVKEIGTHVARISWDDGHESIINLRAVAHHQRI